MLLFVDEHGIVKWQVSRKSSGVSVGEARCACGWVITSGPCQTLVGADLGLHAAWAQHVGVELPANF